MGRRKILLKSKRSGILESNVIYCSTGHIVVALQSYNPLSKSHQVHHIGNTACTTSAISASIPASSWLRRQNILFVHLSWRDPVLLRRQTWVWCEPLIYRIGASNSCSSCVGSIFSSALGLGFCCRLC